MWRKFLLKRVKLLELFLMGKLYERILSLVELITIILKAYSIENTAPTPKNIGRRKLLLKKISRELRKQLTLRKGSHTTVLVAVSGGKDSAVLLDVLVDLLGQRRDVTIVAGTVDEGIEGYRPPSIECAASLCERLGVPHEVVTYPELSFLEMDEVEQCWPKAPI